ncbi:endoprotease [Maridesulfovibrio ferrireducens]|uniref:endoprotease n=1 Tax=Maridesulfovibrio ferrireducens TaxID=246191 RepID=UPI001A2F6A78|nr:endoprotease [Maridesulfovibrio ferrireducens]MBI9112825.1 endoprotease [Maridesulfovibrio ferrireducens]
MSDDVAPEESQAGTTPVDGNEQAKELPSILGGDDAEDENQRNREGEIKEGEPTLRSAPQVDPADYEINYGEGVEIPSHIDKHFRDFARENGVTGEMAQKLVDFNNKLEVARRQDHEQQIYKWAEQINSLPGWQGNAFRQNVSVANKAMKAFASPELVNMIKNSGYNNHPEVVKAFHGIGMRMSEDSYVDSPKPTGRKKTIGEILYPNQPV